MPILTEIFSDKLSNGSSRDLYARVGMHLATYPVSPVTPQFVDHGLFTIDAPNKGSGLWSLSNRVRRSVDVSHFSVTDHAVEEITELGYAVSAKLDYNYNTGFEIWREISNLSAKILQGANHLWNQLLLVQKRQTQNHHQQTRLLLVQRRQTPKHQQ